MQKLETEILDLPMFKVLMEELRGIRHTVESSRDRLDKHIDDEGKSIVRVEKEIGKIREEMAGHRVKLGGVAAFISVVVAGVVGWAFKHIGN